MYRTLRDFKTGTGFACAKLSGSPPDRVARFVRMTKPAAQVARFADADLIQNERNRLRLARDAGAL
jgi:hypothetical protein